jgi:hypothetical protein
MDNVECSFKRAWAMHRAKNKFIILQASAVAADRGSRAIHWSSSRRPWKIQFRDRLLPRDSAIVDVKEGDARLIVENIDEPAEFTTSRAQPVLLRAKRGMERLTPIPVYSGKEWDHAQSY